MCVCVVGYYLVGNIKSTTPFINCQYSYVVCVIINHAISAEAIDVSAQLNVVHGATIVVEIVLCVMYGTLVVSSG